jgi:uncharacterized membrane protein (UPF0127 family)
VRKLTVGKNLQFGLTGLVLVAVVAVALLTSGQPADKKTSQTASACGAYRTDRVISINGQAFNTEVASSSAAKDKGLSGRPCILPNQAMLFPFKNDGHYSFWMQGMKFPIDVIWITSGHKIAAVERDFQPSSYPERRGNKLPAQYVMEVKANRTKELNASIGTPVSM